LASLWVLLRLAVLYATGSTSLLTENLDIHSSSLALKLAACHHTRMGCFLTVLYLHLYLHLY
jgi:hypothetical protein